MISETENGDPVLVAYRPSVVYNNERDLPVSHMALENRTSVVLESRVINEITEGKGDNRLITPRDTTRNSTGHESDYTVLVDNVCKSYEKSHPILSHLCMNVRKGTIYGLLGSSGCGKTTLLSCMVGLKQWDSGDIRVFGQRPGDKGSGPLGRRVGYMPQDIALYDQLSTREVLEYYGRLYGIPSNEVADQSNFLVKFLKLPDKFKLVKDLSGGQKRRVSLAVTLIHNPELLILDEPTVGLDPLLRESIWKYLYKMVQTRQTTIITSTHYIGEMLHANTIGVMRKGKLICEDSPTNVLRKYNCALLEDAVLLMCRQDQNSSQSSITPGSNNNVPCANQEKNYNNYTSACDSELAVISHRKTKTTNKTKNSYNVSVQVGNGNFESGQQPPRSLMGISDSQQDSLTMTARSGMFGRVWGLSTVMWLTFLRHPIFMVMLLLMPTFQMVLTLAVMGTEPKGFVLGVVNDELQYNETCLTLASSLESTTCKFAQLSCRLMSELSKSETIIVVPVESEEQALQNVHNGDMWGYFKFPSNYSQHLEALVTEQRFAGNETLEGSRVNVAMDMSHYLGATLALKHMYEAYETFASNLATSCGLDSREFQLPLLYREPVYGSNEISFHHYITPIVILTVIFEFPMLVTSVLLINDRKQGTLDRSRVAGLRFKEVMISHLLTQGSVIIGQSVICYLVMMYLYHLRVLGSMILYFFLCILTGICGGSLGLLLGVICDNEIEAVMFGIFLGPILLMYEGAISPVESMELWPWRTIAYLSPTTLTIESLRSNIYRGLDVTHPLVYNGIGMMSIWNIMFWVVSICIYIKKYK